MAGLGKDDGAGPNDHRGSRCDEDWGRSDDDRSGAEDHGGTRAKDADAATDKDGCGCLGCTDAENEDTRQ